MAAIQGNGFKQVIHVSNRSELNGVLNTIMPNKKTKTIVQRHRVNRAVTAFRKANHKFDS
ncbi:hypothetical protein JK167_11270 [Levilactobacillus brevis]|uniref:Uncharacterized protein n=1 Tax=Levilactobacillus brevis TaxID=1580 RepID=A0AA41JU85_LEVBR|nr:hypothetical protein [Levilactobacillus brevis]MBS0948263.1 hypothetical protein [Levilactobacillus brevis]MBS1011408.1 hypothetical protein [Levilactobacillus brevis]